MNFIKYKKHLFFALIVVVTFLISVGHFLNLNYEKPHWGGPRENLSFAYNSLKYGVYDDTSNDNPHPDYRREPMYPLILMVGMLFHPGINLSAQDGRCITLGEGKCIEIIIYLKIADIILLMATALLSGYIVFAFSKSIWASAICFFLIALSGSLGHYTSRFFSEPLATFSVVAASFSLYDLTQKEFSFRRAFLCGLLLATLALTKAIFYYLIFLCSLLLFVWWMFQGIGTKNSLKRISFFFLGALILIGPWVVRNFIQLGTFSIAGRSGLILTVRANYNEVSTEEYKALILMYAPRLKWVKKQTYIYVDSAMREKLSKQFKRDGYTRRDQVKSELGLKGPERNDFLFDEAKNRILTNLDNHLALVLPFALRGSSPEVGYGFNPKNASHETIGIKKFGIDVSKYFISAKAFPNIIFITVFFGTFLFSLIFRKWGMIWFLLPSMYGFGMYAFFTHFIPRYSVYLIPIFAICICLAVWRTYCLIKRKNSRSVFTN